MAVDASADWPFSSSVAIACTCARVCRGVGRAAGGKVEGRAVVGGGELQHSGEVVGEHAHPMRGPRNGRRRDRRRCVSRHCRSKGRWFAALCRATTYEFVRVQLPLQFLELVIQVRYVDSKVDGPAHRHRHVHRHVRGRAAYAAASVHRR